MSSTPTKSWWPLSKASSNKEHHIDRRSSTALKHSSGLKSIATAIGLKSKRPSREPLSPVDCSDRSQMSDSTSGPKSPSSPVNSLGPHTPLDTRHRRPRQSLLTLADDPFAGHPPAVFIRRSPVPSLSVYSTPSVTDLISGKNDSPVYRTSYASSSTNSNSLGPDANSMAMLNSHHPFPESKKLHLKRSIGSMQVKLPDGLSRQTSLMSSISGSSPSAQEPQLSDEALVRPRMRSRGMTVDGLPQKSGLFFKEQITQRKQSTPPNTIPATVKAPEQPSKHIPRQTSFSSSRLFAPPTAPPTVGLPAPPQERLDFRQRKGLNSHPSFSSTSTSSLGNDHTSSLGPIHDESQTSKENLPIEDYSFRERVELSLKTQTAPSTPRTLKKLPSQRSLRCAASPPSSMSSKTTTTPDSSGKRKQRNSQQPRLPMPTLSLSITSLQPRNGGPTSPYSINEQKSRKRLFSCGGQRPSTATHVSTGPRQDDTLSVSSLRSDQGTIYSHYKPWAVTRNYPKPSSFWDEGSDTTPGSPVVDYQPQAIMSRDELAKLDASISNANSEQETPLSYTSSFLPSNGLDVFGQEPSRVALSPPPSMRPERNSEWSSDAASLNSNSRTARRPRTADPFVRDSSKGAEIDAGSCRRVANNSAAHLDMIPDSTSLPPPPRRRLLSSNSVRSTASTSTTSTLVQSPIERLNYSKIKLLDRPNTATTPLQASVLGTGSLLPARSAATSRGKARTSGVLEKAIHRRSIMRKPSFLEIDGETDQESEPDVAEKRDSLFLNMKPPSSTTVVNGAGKTGESFLDLARESFDTMRS